MSKHSSLSNECYKRIVSTRTKKYLAKCKSMYLCVHAPWCGAFPHSVCGHAPCISQQENLTGHLAICVYAYDYNNNLIIMCIGLVHGIFTRNI